jgi:hypothetical protein
MKLLILIFIQTILTSHYLFGQSFGIEYLYGKWVDTTNIIENGYIFNKDSSFIFIENKEYIGGKNYIIDNHDLINYYSIDFKKNQIEIELKVSLLLMPEKSSIQKGIIEWISKDYIVLTLSESNEPFPVDFDNNSKITKKILSKIE